MHHLSMTQFKIDQLRKDKMIYALETIAIFLLAFMVTIFLPQFVAKYYYGDQLMTMTANPALLEYIPVVSFGAAVLYFVFAAVQLVMKKMQISKLEKELEIMGWDDGCNCGHDHDHEEMMDMSSEMTMAQAMAKTTPAKKTVKKSVKEGSATGRKTAKK